MLSILLNMFYISVMIILCDYYRYTPFDINTRFALPRGMYSVVLALQRNKVLTIYISRGDSPAGKNGLNTVY